MTVTLDATVGGTTANSYLTLAAADAIVETMLGTVAWTGATENNRIRALVTATRGLDTLTWIGTRTTTTQALAWPRTDASCDGTDYASDAIPSQLSYATFDLANALLTTPTLLQTPPSSDTALVPGIPNRTLSRIKLAVMELDFRTDISAGAQAIVNPLTALPHLATVLGCLTTSTIPGGSSRIIDRVRS
jgi:hypothetical protein